MASKSDIDIIVSFGLLVVWVNCCFLLVAIDCLPIILIVHIHIRIHRAIVVAVAWLGMKCFGNEPAAVCFVPFSILLVSYARPSSVLQKSLTFELLIHN